MNKNLFKEIIVKSTLRHKLIAAGILLLIIASLLYALMLAPYVAHFNSLRAQLKSQKNLLDLKMRRADNLEDLQKEYAQYEKKLQDVTLHFFTESEADAFMKQLPTIVSGFGNRVVLLEPQLKSHVIPRSEKLKKYVLGENLPTEKDIIDYIAKNKKLIDADETSKEPLEQALRMLPEGAHKEKIRTIWQQPNDSDFYADVSLRQMNIETTVRGNFAGILSLLEWFDAYDKIITLSKIKINTTGQASGVETKFTISIYTIE